MIVIPIIIIHHIQQPNPMPTPRPSLTLHQKQAYQGAKLFYNCFLPLTIVLLMVLSFVVSDQLGNVVMYNGLMIGSYFVALRWYKLCNQLDVRLDRDRGRDGEGDTSGIYGRDNPVVTQEELGANINDDVEVYLQKYKNSQSNQPQPQSQPQPQPQGPPKPQKFFCKPCNLLLPYRSRHCQKCQACIQRYDHHCFWIGNCVGYNNHRQFYLFLLCQTVNNVAVLFGSLEVHRMVGQAKSGGNGGNGGDGSWWGWVGGWLYGVEGGSVGFILFTGYLLLYHTMLMVSGMTTWQHMSRTRISYLNYLKPGINPFSKGPLTNIHQFWYHEPTPICYQIPTYQQAKTMPSSCNIIQNQYYSCC